MSANPFKGTGVALITPFRRDQHIDFPALRNLVDRVIADGVDYLVVLGTTAETPTLSQSEKLDILYNVLEQNQGRVPVVCGIGGNNTIAVTQQLKEYPLDQIQGILSVSPYYNRPSQAGLIAHFKAIHDQCPVPVILYNVPGRTGSNMQASTVLELAKSCERIVAVKEASGNMQQSMDLIQHRPRHFSVLSGDDDLALAQIACGFDGVISVAANCYTRLFTEMIQAALNHALTQAQKKHYRLLDGIRLLFEEGNPAGVKAVLAEQGFCENVLRLPMVPVSHRLQEQISQFLKTLE